MKRISLLGVLFSLVYFFQPTPAQAVDGILLSLGSGMDDSLIQSESIHGASFQSAGLVWDYDSPFNSELFGRSELEFELSVGKVKKRDEQMRFYSLRPVFSFLGDTDQQRSWFWQFGVGVSYFDSRTLGPIEFSSDSQFATILGLGMTLDNFRKNRLIIRYNHYSNGYLSSPNPGLDAISLDWQLRW